MNWEDWRERLTLLPDQSMATLADAAGMAASTFRASLMASIAGWRRDPEATSAARGRGAGRPPIVVVTPSDTPAPLLNATAAAILTGRALYLRPSRQGRRFAEAWAALFPGDTRALIRILDPEEKVSGATAGTIAYGADETMEVLAAACGEEPFHPHGDRFSIALLDPGAPCDVEDLVRPLVPWDGRGCLTPRLVGVLTGERGGRERHDFVLQTARRLASALRDAERIAPRSRPPDGLCLALHETFAECRIRGGVVLGPERGTAWSVLVEPAPVLETTPGWRTVRVVPLASAAEFRAFMEPAWSRVEAVGVGATGWGFASTLYAEKAEPLGMMQSPSLARRQSGQPSLLELLAR